jgi:hypothetical protein
MFSLIAIPMSNITELRQNFVDIQAITLKVIAFEIFRVIAVIWR